MKKYCLLFIIILLCLRSTSGEIKNGYENRITSYRTSLKGLQLILRTDNTLSVAENRRIKDKIRSLINHIAYYEITEKLLKKFRDIAPELYHEIDSIKDSRGRITDVYVKFIPKDQGQVAAAGTTSLGQLAGDNHMYCSEYGEGTVSINVWIVSKALIILAHELGHVKYQVPNLNSYVEFYKRNYIRKIFDPNLLGHKHNDPSGIHALTYENRFKEDYDLYLRAGDHPFESPLLLIGDIRKKVDAERFLITLTTL